MQYLETQHHITRFASYKKLLHNKSGQVIGLLPQAFTMRTKRKERELSVNWIEYFGYVYPDNLNELAEDMKKNIKLGAQSALGIANVGKMADALNNKNGISVRVARSKRDASPPNPSHARLVNLPVNDKETMRVLAASFSCVVECKDLPK